MGKLMPSSSRANSAASVVFPDPAAPAIPITTGGNGRRGEDSGAPDPSALTTLRPPALPSTSPGAPEVLPASAQPAALLQTPPHGSAESRLDPKPDSSRTRCPAPPFPCAAPQSSPAQSTCPPASLPGRGRRESLPEFQSWARSPPGRRPHPASLRPTPSL